MSSFFHGTKKGTKKDDFRVTRAKSYNPHCDLLYSIQRFETVSDMKLQIFSHRVVPEHRDLLKDALKCSPIQNIFDFYKEIGYNYKTQNFKG